MSCFADRVFEIAVLGAKEPERIAAEDHANGCPGCRSALAEASATFDVIDAMPAPARPSAEVLARVSEQVLREMPQATIWRWLLGFIVGTSVVMALALGGEGAIDVVTGSHCLAEELLAAIVPVTIAWGAIRKQSRSPLVFANIAAGGALAADVYLHFRCPASSAMVHLFAFHVAGVVLAAVIGAAAGSGRSQNVTVGGADK